VITKAQIYNLALSALLLSRKVSDTDNDPSNEIKVLNTWYDIAFQTALEELDLDSLAVSADLLLAESDPNDKWLYAYKYPSDCVFFRRIESLQIIDNRDTRIPYRIGMLDGQKVIFTNEYQAIGDYVSKDISLAQLDGTAALAIALKLASLSAPLITGKGAKTLVQDINAKYLVAKLEAKKKDQMENFQFVDPETESEFVRERMS